MTKIIQKYCIGAVYCLAQYLFMSGATQSQRKSSRVRFSPIWRHCQNIRRLQIHCVCCFVRFALAWDLKLFYRGGCRHERVSRHGFFSQKCGRRPWVASRATFEQVYKFLWGAPRKQFHSYLSCSQWMCHCCWATSPIERFQILCELIIRLLWRLGYANTEGDSMLLKEQVWETEFGHWHLWFWLGEFVETPFRKKDVSCLLPTPCAGTE